MFVLICNDPNSISFQLVFLVTLFHKRYHWAISAVSSRGLYTSVNLNLNVTLEEFCRGIGRRFGWPLVLMFVNMPDWRSGCFPQTQPQSAIICMCSTRFISHALNDRIHRAQFYTLVSCLSSSSRVWVWVSVSVSFVSMTEGNRMWRVKQLRGAMTEEGASEPRTVTTAETTKIQNIWLSSAGTCATLLCVSCVCRQPCFLLCMCVRTRLVYCSKVKACSLWGPARLLWAEGGRERGMEKEESYRTKVPVVFT